MLQKPNAMEKCDVKSALKGKGYKKTCKIPEFVLYQQPTFKSR